jgi:hypothetical protein
VYRCDDKVLVRFQQLRLGVRATLGGSPRGLIAPVSNLVSQICGLFAGKYSGLARGERRSGRGRTSRALIYLKWLCGRAFWTSVVDVTHPSLAPSTASAVVACVGRPLRSASYSHATVPASVISNCRSSLLWALPRPIG